MTSAKELLSNIKPEPRNMAEIINQVQQLKFDEHDERAKSALKEFYKKITSVTYTFDERLMIMSSLNQMTEFSCVVLGRFLDEEEADIKKKWDLWIKSGSNPENLPYIKLENLQCKDTNINIINELRLKAKVDSFTLDIEKRFISVFEYIMDAPGSRISMTDNILIIKYPYERAVRRDINILLDSIGLYDSINVIFK